MLARGRTSPISDELLLKISEMIAAVSIDYDNKLLIYRGILVSPVGLEPTARDKKSHGCPFRHSPHGSAVLALTGQFPQISAHNRLRASSQLSACLRTVCPVNVLSGGPEDRRQLCV
jgi:hypothetical protein